MLTKLRKTFQTFCLSTRKNPNISARFNLEISMFFNVMLKYWNFCGKEKQEFLNRTQAKFQRQINAEKTEIRNWGNENARRWISQKQTKTKNSVINFVVCQSRLLFAWFLLFNTEKNSFAPHFQLEREERNKEFISSRNKSTEKEADEKEKQQKSVKMSENSEQSKAVAHFNNSHFYFVSLHPDFGAFISRPLVDPLDSESSSR